MRPRIVANDCPAKLLVEEVGRLDQLRVRVRAVGVQDAVLHVALGVTRISSTRRSARRRNSRWRNAASRRLGVITTPANCVSCDSRPRRGAHELLRPVGVQLAFEPVDLALLERLDHHQAVDEEPVALGGRHAAGGRVRARDEAHLLQVRHARCASVAGDSSRPEWRDSAREPTGWPSLDVAFDQRLEEVLRARIQHGADSTAARRGNVGRTRVDGRVDGAVV